MLPGPDWALGGCPHSVAACIRCPSLRTQPVYHSLRTHAHAGTHATSSRVGLQSAASLWWIVRRARTEILKITRAKEREDSEQRESLTSASLSAILTGLDGPVTWRKQPVWCKWEFVHSWIKWGWVTMTKHWVGVRNAETMQFIVNISIKKKDRGQN